MIPRRRYASSRLSHTGPVPSFSLCSQAHAAVCLLCCVAASPCRCHLLPLPLSPIFLSANHRVGFPTRPNSRVPPYSNQISSSPPLFYIIYLFLPFFSFSSSSTHTFPIPTSHTHTIVPHTPPAFERAPKTRTNTNTQQLISSNRFHTLCIGSSLIVSPSSSRSSISSTLNLTH